MRRQATNHTILKQSAHAHHMLSNTGRGHTETYQRSDTHKARWCLYFGILHALEAAISPCSGNRSVFGSPVITRGIHKHSKLNALVD
jgi:hypothetical protein